MFVCLFACTTPIHMIVLLVRVRLMTPLFIDCACLVRLIVCSLVLRFVIYNIVISFVRLYICSFVHQFVIYYRVCAYMNVLGFSFVSLLICSPVCNVLHCSFVRLFVCNLKYCLFALLFASLQCPSVSLLLWSSVYKMILWYTFIMFHLHTFCNVLYGSFVCNLKCLFV